MSGLVESPGLAAGVSAGDGVGEAVRGGGDGPGGGGATGRAPDFFIVGNPKSGTTALYEMLRRHPQIYMPELKEPHFLASSPGRALTSGAAQPTLDPLPRTLDAYLALFEGALPEQLVGEASASYLRSPEAPARIHELAPDARIVAILREPASFLCSLHLQHLQDHVERERDFRVALRREEIVRDGRTVRRYSDRVHYVEHLRRYHQLFAEERVLVLIYDDFQRENEATVRSVLRFLRIDDSVPVVPLRANPTVRMRSVGLAKLVHAVRTGQGPIGRSLNVPLEALTTRRVRRAALGLVLRRVLYGAPGAPDERLMGELRARFKPEVVALSEYLGRDLVSLWGYERLG
ncbi:MAG: sulfotransferase [Solirubrobacteraceae bacterium]